MPKMRNQLYALCTSLSLLSLALTGQACAQSPSLPNMDYLQALSTVVSILPPGGKTIGGPGYANLVVGQQYNITAGGFGNDSNICVTITNVGDIQVKLSMAHSTHGIEANIKPYTTKTLCSFIYPFVYSSISCGIPRPLVPGKTCKVVWRIDRT